MAKRVKAKSKPRRTRAGQRATPIEAGWDADAREDLYARLSRAAVKHSETDKLVRNLLAAALSVGPTTGTILADDLSLLRWVLKKMEENRRMAEVKALDE